MEGRPWLRILLVLIGFTVLGWPVWIVTHPAEAASPVATALTIPQQTLRIDVTVTASPMAFDLEYLGTSLLKKAPVPGKVTSVDWNVAIPKEGVDLFVSGSWLTGVPAAAVRVQVTRGDDSLADQTFWSDGSLAETVTVKPVAP